MDKIAINEPYWLRGIRGAITVEHDEPSLIHQATQELLQAIVKANDIDDLNLITSIFFTTTPDLISSFPAEAARALGMDFVPLMCGQEMAVQNSLPRTIRVMVHVHTPKAQAEVKHIYLREAERLRPDLLAKK